MSGGVDSSVAAYLAREAGFECIGVTLKLFDDGGAAAALPGRKTCCALTDVNDARDVAVRLDIPHYVLNFTDVFREQVMRRFVDTYLRGETPNPCIDCNRFIKFDRLLHRAAELLCDTVVTGHYARVEKQGSRYILRKARDPAKDQSYVLYTATQKQLSVLRFPLGDLVKPAVRAIAEQQGFGNARKKESQDICFVPQGDYGAFIERFTGTPLRPGNIVDGAGAVIGRHRGVARYTIGQRRGTGVAVNAPVYVTEKSAWDNTITAGPEAALYRTALTARDINLVAVASFEKPLRVTAKTRYLQREEAATVEQTGEDSFTVVFDRPQRAVTPGQAVVLYVGDVVAGGGTIARAF
jgi:tRNA-specific 2-thiouridylase